MGRGMKALLGVRASRRASCEAERRGKRLEAMGSRGYLSCEKTGSDLNSMQISECCDVQEEMKGGPEQAASGTFTFLQE